MGDVGVGWNIGGSLGVRETSSWRQGEEEWDEELWERDPERGNCWTVKQSKTNKQKTKPNKQKNQNIFIGGVCATHV